MPQPDSIPVLNQLLAVLCRSLPQYLTDARPYSVSGDDSAVEVLTQIAEDQTMMSARVTDLIQESERRIDLGGFPIQFSALHDLSLEYLVGKAIECQRRDIRTIEACIDDLRFAPAARSLAEETLGMAKGHLESLQEVSAG